MGYTYRAGIEPETGRVALGRRACSMLADGAVLHTLFASQLPYRAILYNPRTQTYRLAPLRRKRSGEQVAHPAPFKGTGVWPAPRWIAEIVARET